MGPFRVLVSDMVVLTMCEPPLASSQQVEQYAAAVQQVKPGIPVIATVLDPVPAEDVAGERVAYFTTAPGGDPRPAARLARRPITAPRSTAVVGSLSTARRCGAALELPEVAAADTYLVEIKAAAIDVVADAARRAASGSSFATTGRGPSTGEPILDEALLALADEAVAGHA